MHRACPATAGVRSLFAMLRGMLALGAVLALAASAVGQTPATQLAGATVVAVRCVAEHPLPPELIPPLATQAGNRFDPALFAADVERLRATNRFIDVIPYFLLPETGGVELVLDLVAARDVMQQSAPPRALFPAELRVRAQSPDSLPEPVLPEIVPTPKPNTSTGETVIDVRIEGNDAVPLQKILSLIRTRTEREFDQQTLEDDVRRLTTSRMFLNVKARSQRTPSGGVIVTFTVAERPVLKEIKFLGNKKIKEKKLREQAGLKLGKPLDPYTVEDARKRLEEHYKEQGYNATRVEVVEGSKIGDTRAIFLINEGSKQRVWNIRFKGNTVVSGARLETQIQTRRPILWVYKGFADVEKIDGDVDRLTAYYRSLGYFQARIGRELEWDEDQDWLTVTFVIDEGPRYRIRNIAVAGNLKFSSEELLADLQLKPGDYFDQPKLNADVARLTDHYGGVGHIFADIQAATQFHEEPGVLDLVYNIEEGKRYRVGRIEVQIGGEFPHTRIRTVLNRMSLRPGDVVDTRELRASERRLKASQLFNVDPTKGISPKIVLVPPENEDTPSSFAKRPSTPKKPRSTRSQSPDGVEAGAPGRPVVHDRAKQQPPQTPLPGTSIPRPPVFRGQGPSDDWDDAPRQGASASASARLNWQQPSQPRRFDTSTAAATAARPAGTQTAAQSIGNPSTAPYRSAGGSPARTGEPPVVRAGMPTVRAQSPSGNGYPASEYWRDYRNAPTGGANAWSNGANAATANSAGSNAAPPGSYAPPPGTAYPAAAGSTILQGGPPANPAFVPPGFSPSATQTLPFSPPPVGNAGPAPVSSAYPQAGTLPPPRTGGPMSEIIPLPPDNAYEGIGDGGSAIAQDAPPDPFVNLEAQAEEARTGRLMFGVGVNSDAGVVGNVVLEEQNFDITRVPDSFQDFIDGSAFRGNGQRLRIEAVPGTQVHRYMFNFMEPYLFDTPVSFGTSGFFFNRRYRDWDEQRIGGQVSLGYQLTPDLSITGSLRVEDVKISGERFPPPPEVLEVLGHTDLYTAKVALAHDTRDSTFLPTEGHLIQLAFEQGFGEFDFPRGTLDIRQYFLMHQRADGSGRHVLGVSGQIGVAGNGTPVFEHFFAGGTTTLRGFSFRGASPVKMGTIVGGEFQMLGSVEYLLPLTADDALRAVIFCDFGTVEEDVRIDWDEFRVAPGFGLRISVPALGPAPIALDIAIPVNRAPTDDIQQFSFRVGLFR